MRKVGKFKTKIRFDMHSPYATGPELRCLIQHKTDFMTMSIPEAKSLWLQIGESMGVTEKRLRTMLDMVPYAARPVE